MEQIFKSENIIVALISALTSIIVFFITLFTKKYFDSKILSSKLEIEHKFDQQKKVKEVLAKNKVHLNNACESLKKRIGNLQRKYDKGWLSINEQTYDDYYHFSFVYRFLAVYAWIKIIEKEMIYLDTTISNKVDLEFIKFLKVFPRIMSSDYLPIEDGEGEETQDHFYRDEMNDYSNFLICENGVISYSEFLSKLRKDNKKYKKLLDFFVKLNPEENRYRWDRIYFMQLSLVAFLNEFGYDFQYTPSDKLIKFYSLPRKSNYTKNYLELFADFKLTESSGFKPIKKIIINEVLIYS